MTETVSVVIPVYKETPYLGQALDSVAFQTYLSCGKINVHVIIDGEGHVPDAIVPPTLKNNIHVHSIPHGGVSVARNYGIAVSKGSAYIAFLDSDDIWCPEKLDRQMDLMRRHPKAGLIYTNSYWINKGGDVLKRTQKEQYGILPGGNILLHMLKRNYIITSSILLKKEVIDKLGAFDTTLEVTEDWDFNLKVAAEFEIYAVQEPMIYYRLHMGGAHYRLDAMLRHGYRVFDRWAPSNMPELAKLKAQIPLNLAGSALYTGQYLLAWKFIKEALRWDRLDPKIYFMMALGLMPPPLKRALLVFRDRWRFLP